RLWNSPHFTKPWRFELTSFGLERMLLEGQYERDDEFYRSLRGQEPQAFFQCHPPLRRLSNSFCTAYVHFSGDRLATYIEIPEDFLPQWLDAAIALRDLVRSWQMPAIPKK